MVRLAGNVSTNAGVAVDAAAVAIFATSVAATDTTSTASAAATTTTNASGNWSSLALAEDRYDVRVTSGGSIRWLRYADEVQHEGAEFARLALRNPADTFVYDIVPGAITANRTLNLPLLTANDTLVVLAEAQTLSNKTLTSPVVNTQLTGTAMGTGASQGAIGNHTTPAMSATVAGHVPVPPNNTTTFLRGDGTFAAPSADISARVFNSANISLTSGVQTVLTFDSERFDTDTIHSTVTNTGRLTATTAGKYLIIGQVRFAANGTGNRSLLIRLNAGTNIAFHLAINAGVTDETVLIVETLYNLAATDYVELLALQSSGGALNVEVSGNQSPEFMMAKVLG